MPKEVETFTITVTMPTRWIPAFLGMLKRMHYLGQIGSSRGVHFWADGDGDFRPAFVWDTRAEPAAPNKEVNGETYFDAG